MADAKQHYAVSAKGAAVAFSAGALLATGYAVYRRMDDKRTVRAAVAGGAFNLGLYLWVPAAFRDIWLWRR